MNALATAKRSRRQVVTPDSWARLLRVAEANRLSMDVLPLAEGGLGNDVWFFPDVVLRISRKEGSTSLSKETRASKLLKPTVNYPKLVDAGELDGYEWTLSQRLGAFQLRRVWPYKGQAERTKAISESLDFIKQIQLTPLEEFKELGRERDRWYLATDHDIFVSFLTEIAGRMSARGTPIDPYFLEQVVDEHARLCSLVTLNVPDRVGHLDFNLGNVLTDIKQVVAITDFEWMDFGPPDIDLDRFISGINRLGAPPGVSPMAPLVPLVDKIASFSPRGEWANRLRLYQMTSHVSACLFVPNRTESEEIYQIFESVKLLTDLLEGNNHIDILEERYERALADDTVLNPRIWL